MSCLLSVSAFRLGIIKFKTLVLTALVFAWVLVAHPASFKSEVDWRAGGPEGLWFLHGIL